MEVNLKEPIHIEFYGLPGCGKSTISHMVADQLRTQGIKVYEPSYDLDHNLNFIFRKIRKLSNAIFFYLCNYKEYRILQQLAKENGYINFRDSIKQIANIVPKIQHYQKHKKKVYIWDEGLVQSSISLAVNSKVDTRRIEKRLFLIAGQQKIIKVYLKLNIETALKRMEERNSNDSRIEQEPNENKKQEMMTRFEKCCEEIETCYVIEEYDIEKMVNKLIKWIRLV